LLLAVVLAVQLAILDLLVVLEVEEVVTPLDLKL
jgi:hypothetical protein